MNLELKDKVIIVTGTTSGIGLATAHELVTEGTTVVGTARTTPTTMTLPKRLDFVATDMTDPDASEQLVTYAMKKHGVLMALSTTRPTLPLVRHSAT